MVLSANKEQAQRDAIYISEKSCESEMAAMACEGYS